eukprot:2007398-Alexandrium_andersonii.AAC.1
MALTSASEETQEVEEAVITVGCTRAPCRLSMHMCCQHSRPRTAVVGATACRAPCASSAC